MTFLRITQKIFFHRTPIARDDFFANRKRNSRSDNLGIRELPPDFDVDICVLESF
jgi:hypothetical protein